jgi:hypothetical protein
MLKGFRTINIVLLLLSPVFAHAIEPQHITLSNSLSGCIHVESVETATSHGIPLLKLTYRTVQNLGQCGCKSALASYRVSLIQGKALSEILTGKISFPTSGESYLPLSSGQQMIGGNGIRIHFSCAPPA